MTHTIDPAPAATLRECLSAHPDFDLTHSKTDTDYYNRRDQSDGDCDTGKRVGKLLASLTVRSGGTGKDRHSQIKQIRSGTAGYLSGDIDGIQKSR